jgi:hypothetical protein
MKFDSGKGTSKGEGISVSAKSLLSYMLLFSASSITSYISKYLFRMIKANPN